MRSSLSSNGFLGFYSLISLVSGSSSVMPSTGVLSRLSSLLCLTVSVLASLCLLRTGEEEFCSDDSEMPTRLLHRRDLDSLLGSSSVVKLPVKPCLVLERSLRTEVGLSDFKVSSDFLELTSLAFVGDLGFGVIFLSEAGLFAALLTGAGLAGSYTMDLVDLRVFASLTTADLSFFKSCFLAELLPFLLDSFCLTGLGAFFGGSTFCRLGALADGSSTAFTGSRLLDRLISFVSGFERLDGTFLAGLDGRLSSFFEMAPFSGSATFLGVVAGDSTSSDSSTLSESDSASGCVGYKIYGATCCIGYYII